jgi:hypothetical protein
LLVNSVCGIGNSLNDGVCETVRDLCTSVQVFVKGLLTTTCKAALRVVDVVEKAAEGVVDTLTGSTPPTAD